MKVGITLPEAGEQAIREKIIQVAKQAEEGKIGFIIDVGETYQSYKATITKERSCYIQNELALNAALLKN